ncbi:hypothetical protein Ssi03_16250 [Sphaerisporangium siamense]|uniref:Putative alkaline shock family protein YloU n=1 Tax=Sphaerisporangium siamense TaxID=795645 RepID=A0A7W7D9A2_9ACTN|nr:Asp23/Gls24 family envelope stress response protein [Sphaerisporangium siamense]MBB4702612.1 putative alkaline shock family protein YloU [Sphaerisporangium siamense]GII83635.1 hypothetical protein Ssi03_16250 [Sphaerisporangium siamense]
MTSTAGRTGAPERLEDRIAQAVTGCPGIASLAGGLHLGRGPAGVAVRDTGVEITVVARYGRPIPEIADEVRAAVGPLVPGVPVDVRVDDIATAGDEDAPSRSTGEGDGNG